MAPGILALLYSDSVKFRNVVEVKPKNPYPVEFEEEELRFARLPSNFSEVMKSLETINTAYWLAWIVLNTTEFQLSQLESMSKELRRKQLTASATAMRILPAR